MGLMRIKEILELPTRELALVLEGLVTDKHILKNEINSAIDPNRKKLARISKKIVKITIELQHRGWEAIEYDGYVKYKPLGNGKEQRKLI